MMIALPVVVPPDKVAVNAVYDLPVTSLFEACCKCVIEPGGGAAAMVNNIPLLICPATVTVTLPVVVPVGTGTTMLELLQFVGSPFTPLKLTVLLPCVAPKFAPKIVTDVPTGPDAGDRLVMLGTGIVTVNGFPLLTCPATVTVTLPVVAPAGTGTTMLVLPQLVGVPVIPLKLTVLVPCVAPKFVPTMLTDVPTGPDVGVRLVMLGTGTPDGVVTVAVFEYGPTFPTLSCARTR